MQLPGIHLRTSRSLWGRIPSATWPQGVLAWDRGTCQCARAHLRQIGPGFLQVLTGHLGPANRTQLLQVTALNYLRVSCHAWLHWSAHRAASSVEREHRLDRKEHGGHDDGLKYDLRHKQPAWSPRCRARRAPCKPRAQVGISSRYMPPGPSPPAENANIPREADEPQIMSHCPASVLYRWRA
jgi:hypothetical protein